MTTRKHNQSRKKPSRAKNRKHVVVLFIIILMLLLAIGCDQTQREPGQPPTDQNPTQGAVTDSAIEEPEEPQKPADLPVTPEPPAQPEPQTPPAPSNPPAPQEPVAPVPSDSNLNTAASQLVWGGNTGPESKEIALTFDSGWEYDQTLALLEVLDQYQVKSTFFLRGGWVTDHPELAQEIHQRGHSIENHSQAHGHMNSMTVQEITADLIESTTIIQETIGVTPHLFRPPYGEYNNQLLNILGEEGYSHTIMWTIDSHDWADTMNGVAVTEQYVISRVLNKASDNGIVLMHVGGPHTVEALPEIITGLREAGYSLVKVEDLI